MLNIVLYGVLVHTLFLASIFLVYFQSPVIQGLNPQNNLDNAPARRLVLFVADGLRAESFYRNGCSRTKFLQNIILKVGIHGISNTRVPTESRPGHVALIAGLYEDPSAVLKGWQKNPVDFDSVFNRSRITYSWGSPDIVSIFTSKPNEKNNNYFPFSYDPSDEDFSGRTSTIALDNWVFDNVDGFFKNIDRFKVDQDKSVFFLHLLGLDTSGHVHKPNSKLFDENLLAVDKGISKVVKIIDAYFNDGKTAYIFTADHGMTDGGSHGSGNDYETKTPFIAWGAGINHWRNIPKKYLDNNRNYQIVSTENVPSFDIDQADVAPLMASLIGIAIPVNNFGKLHEIYLNTSMEYKSKAVYGNALQMSTQYKYLRNDFHQGGFSQYLSDFNELTNEIIQATENRIKSYISNKNYEDAIFMGKIYLQKSLDGIEYFQNYYQFWLLASVSFSMLGWILFLKEQITTKTKTGAAAPSSVSTNFNTNNNNNSFLMKIISIGSLCILTIIFILFQKLPWTRGTLLLLPYICWWPINLKLASEVILNKKIWIFFLAVDSLVWTFFYRQILTIIFILLPFIYTIRNSNVTLHGRHLWWILTCCILAIFPSLPTIGKSLHNFELLCVGLLLWFGKFIYSIYTEINRIKIINLLLFIIGSVNLLIVSSGFDRQHGLSTLNQLISWVIFVASIILPLFQTKKLRLSAIFDGLCIPFLMMSLSYEPIFLFALVTNLNCWVNLELKTPKTFHDISVDVSEKDVKRAYLIMVYVLISFFGTGNLASISSFDPNCVRCFVATFSPFLMATLIIIKLLIPVLFVVCASTTLNLFNKENMEKLFIILLIICDIMCMHFLYLVKNKGSWLDIGVSISHFVIMECTVLVLCVLQILAKLILTFEIPKTIVDNIYLINKHK